MINPTRAPLFVARPGTPEGHEAPTNGKSDQVTAATLPNGGLVCESQSERMLLSCHTSTHSICKTAKMVFSPYIPCLVVPYPLVPYPPSFLLGSLPSQGHPLLTWDAAVSC